MFAHNISTFLDMTPITEIASVKEELILENEENAIYQHFLRIFL